MAKRGTLTHPRTRRLAAALARIEHRQVQLYEALGLMESLWHATAARAPRGDIGRIADQDIADEVWWAGDATALVGALVGAGVLDQHPTHRLIVHGWSEHCDDTTRRGLQRRGQQFFADGTPTRRPATDEEPATKDADTDPTPPADRTCPDMSGHDATSPVMTPLPGQARPEPCLGHAEPEPAGRPAAVAEFRRRAPDQGTASPPDSTPLIDAQGDETIGGPPAAALRAECLELLQRGATASELLGLVWDAAAVLRKASRTGRTGDTLGVLDLQQGKGGRGSAPWLRATRDRLRDRVAPLEEAVEAQAGPFARRLQCPELTQQPAAVGLWSRIVDRLQADVPEHLWRLWLVPTVGVTATDRLVVAVPSEGWLSHAPAYDGRVVAAAAAEGHPIVGVDWVVAPDLVDRAPRRPSRGAA